MDEKQAEWNRELARRLTLFHTPKKVWECVPCRRRSPADQKRTKADEGSVRCCECRQPMTLRIPVDNTPETTHITPA